MALELPLGGTGGCKSSIFNLDELHLRKDEIIFESSSTLSTMALSTTIELANTVKEAGLDANPKVKGEDSFLKKGSKAIFL